MEGQVQELLYEDLTYAIRHCIFDVHNDLGVGFDEETYHQALIQKFEKEGITFVSKERKRLEHRGNLIRKLELDFLVADKIVLALKCLPCNFLQANYVQLFTELKLWKKQVGLLANFGLPKVNIERRVFHEKPLIVEESYDHIKGRMNETERLILKNVRETILTVAELHGLGFGKTVVQQLVEKELAYQRIDYTKGFQVPVNYLGKTIRNFKIRHLLIEQKIVCCITALQNSVTHHDVSKIKSYLKVLKLQTGLAVNFGKSKLEIRGVRSD